VHFVNLQYGKRNEELAALKEKYGITVHDWPGAVEDLDDFAAQVDALDAVVSMANTTVHFAGALAKPVLTLVPLAPSWRWQIDRGESPWYPSMRLLRQAPEETWKQVASRARDELHAILADAPGTIATPPPRPPALHDTTSVASQTDRLASDWLRQAEGELVTPSISLKDFCDRLYAITPRLLTLQGRFTTGQLDDVRNALARRLDAATLDLNLESFAKLAQGIYRIWWASKRDQAFMPIAEMFARHAGRVATTARSPNRALDGIFNIGFQMAFKTSDDWRQTMAYLNRSLCQPYFHYLERVYPASSKPRILQSGRPRRIGYLTWSSQLEGSYALGRVVYSIARGHSETIGEQNRIFVYSQNQSSAHTERAFAAVPGVTFRDLHKITDIAGKVAAIAADKIDALVLSGFDADSLRIVQARPASVQLYMPLGMHPMAAPFFDGYLLYENLAADAPALGVPMEHAKILPWTLDAQFLCPGRSEAEIARARKSLPAGKPVFAVFCRMEKATIGFLETMAEILQRLPEAALVIAGPNDRSRIFDFFSSRRLSDRVSLPGEVDPHAYHHLIDVFVDTFPMCGGLAPIEAMAKGIPTVFLDGAGTESSRGLRDPELRARDRAHYVELAVRLASDADFLAKRRDAARSIAANASRVGDTARAIVEHIEALGADLQP
ncbi:MAG: glycosyltransferase, partial [Gammaproteobacteria bacterium]|nr:glycosyltransferase [Gammaproteobacteria bacterium]